MGGSTGSSIGLGAIGVAIAAFEHFTDKGQASSTPAPGTPPQAPGRQAGSDTAVPPPPPPPAPAPASDQQPDTGSVPPPPPPPPAGTSELPDARLLIRAMIAAANADGEIDAEERAAIQNQLAETGLSAQETAFVQSELASPPSVDEIAAEVSDGKTALQVYAVSLMAIDVDTDAEQRYLEALRSRLGIDDAQARELHQRFDEPPV
jgi:hypothetical protein